jgi:hypothetical protein
MEAATAARAAALAREDAVIDPPSDLVEDLARVADVDRGRHPWNRW